MGVIDEKIMKISYTILFIFLNTTFAILSKNAITNIGKMLSNNHYKHLNFYHLDENLPISMNLNLWKQLMKYYKLEMRTFYNLKEDNNDLEPQDFIITFFDNNNNSENIISNLWSKRISNRLPRRSLIILKESLMEDFKKFLLEINQYLGIFAATYDVADQVKFYEIISLKNQIIIHEIEFESNGIIREIVDLQGVHLHGITGEWRPYFNVNDCSQYTG